MRERSFRFTRLAFSDLDDIWESIARDSGEAADRVVAEIHDQIKLLAKFPGAGHRRKDLAENRRLLFFPTGKYMIAYRVQREAVLIVRILHAARNIAVLLRERRSGQA